MRFHIDEMLQVIGFNLISMFYVLLVTNKKKTDYKELCSLILSSFKMRLISQNIF